MALAGGLGFSAICVYKGDAKFYHVSISMRPLVLNMKRLLHEIRFVHVWHDMARHDTVVSYNS
jgi:hypothetical protein